MDRLSRRAFLSGGSAAAIAAGGRALFWTPALLAQMPMPKASGALDERLDAYVGSYMAAMNAPGLTLGLTDQDKTQRAGGYGYANVDLRLPVNPDLLFQIGSITKSFVALVLLQMREEGKLDLQKPVLDYLPGLPIACGFGTINGHHLLTHTSGLPDNLDLFSHDPGARLVQGFAPGEHFHYSNAGFCILGLLAEKLDGRTWRECVTARILTPLEMTTSTGVISSECRNRSAVGYQPFRDDQVYPRQGRLAPAPNLVTDDTAGCIASTPGDMIRYARMLINRGQGPKGRIVSKESFGLFSKAYVKTPDLGPTASYGYGIGVDTLDGHKILRHTGGMVAFASSIHIDLDGGVACFASINAMQGYRPTPVTEYAVRLLRAQRESKPLPAAPAIVDAREVENAADYAGTFTSPEGHRLSFAAQDKVVALVADGKEVPLQHVSGDSFVSTIEGVYFDDSFEFARKQEDPAQGVGDAGKKPKTPVAELSYRDQWFTKADYSGPRRFTTPADWSAYVGHYRGDSPWIGDVRVYVLKDQLMLSGEHLAPLGGALFRFGDEPWLPETAEFMRLFEGKARLLRVAGIDLARVEVD